MDQNKVATINRVTQAGIVPPVGINRTSQIVRTIIPANTTFPIFQAGSQFYLTVATGVVSIKPNNGSENEYSLGTGLNVDISNFFSNIQIRNLNSYPVVIEIFVGFGGYIDNRVILYDPNSLSISYPTYPVPNVSSTVSIPDLSGTTILDQNGTPFLALSRQGIYISNLTLADAYDLSNVGGTKDVLSVFPLSSIVYPSQGDYEISVPSGTINAIVSELYYVIRPN